MKSKYLVAALALTLVACSNDETDNRVVNEPTAARFYGEISEAATRAAGTTWTAGDAIGVTGTSSSTTYTNIKYEYVANGQPFNVATSGNEIYYQNNNSVTFSAYYPFSGTEKSAPSTVTKTIAAADQDATNKSVEGKFTPQSQIDYLYGTGTGERGKNDGNVTFSFKHMMSKLVLVFIAGYEVNLNDLTGYKLDDLEMNGSFDPTDGTAAASTTSNTKTLTIEKKNIPFTSENGKQISSLILYPQTANAATLTVTVDGREFTANLIIPAKTETSHDNGLVSGKKYTYNVTVGTQAVTVSQADIDDWTEGVTPGREDVDAMP